jgi:crossover junction endodeoxyribonuclease RuvC
VTLVAGLDLSLTGAGVALAWRDPHGQEGIQATRHSTDSTSYLLAPRWARVSRQAVDVMEAACALGVPDLVLVEGMAHAQSGGATQDRAGVWWLVVGRLLNNGVVVVEVVTQHLKMYATGRGTKVSKAEVVSEVTRRYGHLLPHLRSDDEADAIALACLGLHRVTGSGLVDLPQTHTRALASVKWPPTVPDGTTT